jgi:hypothetical protein
MTRNPSSPPSQKLAALAADIAETNLSDLASLKLTFKDANVIFVNTDFWEP